MINFFIMTVTVRFLFDVPLKGDGLTLTLGALFYVAAATGYGLFISTFTSSQVAAVFAGAVLSMLPTMQFSGMLQPVSTLEGARASWVPLADELLHAHECRCVHQGLGFTDMVTDLLALSLFCPAFLLLSALLLRKQEK